MEGDWVAICQALHQVSEAAEWRERERCTNKVKEVSKCTGVKKAGKRVAGLGKLPWRKEEEQRFISEKDELILAHERRSELRERLLEVSKVDAAQALRRCEERQLEVCESEVSCTSWDPLEEAWRRQGLLLLCR